MIISYKYVLSVYKSLCKERVIQQPWNSYRTLHLGYT